MAKLYEFVVNREVLKNITTDVRLTLDDQFTGNINDNFMEIAQRPHMFLNTLMDGKPGFHIRVGRIRTDRFEGEGLHMYTHSGSEGYLDT